MIHFSSTDAPTLSCPNYPESVKPLYIVAKGSLRMTDKYCQRLRKEIERVLRRVWALQQPAHLNGQVMVSASGDGIYTDLFSIDDLAGPFRSPVSLYAWVFGFSSATLRERFPEAEGVFAADPLVFSHTDLVLPNILVDDKGHLTGIVDWENAGWLPMSRQWFYLCQDSLFTHQRFRKTWGRMKIPTATRDAHNLTKKIGADTKARMTKIL